MAIEVSVIESNALISHHTNRKSAAADPETEADAVWALSSGSVHYAELRTLRR